jgi:parallel beta-helix repeat protein
MSNPVKLSVFSFALFLFPFLLNGAYASVACINETGSCFNTIQGAINSASAYQTVVVTGSTYENVVINKTGITLTTNISTAPEIVAIYNTSTINIISDNVTVRNIRIVQNVTPASGTSSVLTVDSVKNITIHNNTIQAKNSYGIYINSSFDNILTSNIISSSNELGDRPGIYIISSSNNTLISNIISMNDESGGNYGIDIEYSSNNIFTSNIISTNSTDSNYGIFIISGSNNIFTSNTISTNSNIGSNSGIVIDTSSNNTFTSNTISTNGEAGGNYGISISDSSNNIFTSNTISTNGEADGNVGIEITGYNNTFTSNTISTNGTDSNTGIIIGSGYNNTFTSNNISTNGTGSDNNGIYIGYGSNNIFTSNTISTNGEVGGNDGIIIGDYSSNNIFTSNNVTAKGSYSYGVMFVGSVDNYIIDSLINADFVDIYSSDIVVSHNYLINSIFNKTDIVFAPGSFGKIFVQWRLDIRVTGSNGSPVSGAIVVGNDTDSVVNMENPTSNFTATTNSSGYIPQQILTEFMANESYNASSGYLYFNNYSVIVSKPGYTDKMTVFVLDGYRLMNIVLSIPINIVSLFGKGQDSYELGYDDANSILYSFVNNVNVSGSLQSGWNHVVMTFDSGEIRLYVNGKNVGSSSTSNKPAVNSRSIVVGNGSTFRMDEIRFYSRPLSSPEIEQHYMVGNALKAIIYGYGSGSFGRNFNISAVTSDGLFASRYIAPSDLVAGSTQSVNLQNVTGIPSFLVITSNSCNQKVEASENQLRGVYC